MSHKIAVEVVYALPEKQYLQRVTLEEGATVEATIRASGIRSEEHTSELQSH